MGVDGGFLPSIPLQHMRNRSGASGQGTTQMINPCQQALILRCGFFVTRSCGEEQWRGCAPALFSQREAPTTRIMCSDPWRGDA